jgi:hypothetical protein
VQRGRKFNVPLNKLNNERRADIWYESAFFSTRWLKDTCRVSALKISKNIDNETVNPPYPERPVMYTMMGK